MYGMKLKHCTLQHTSDRITGKQCSVASRWQPFWTIPMQRRGLAPSCGIWTTLESTYAVQEIAESKTEHLCSTSTTSTVICTQSNSTLINYTLFKNSSGLFE